MIHTLDLHYLARPGSIASYVVVGEGGPVMVETGPGCSVEALERGLADIGFAPGDVRHVLVTHIHFDHAGATGWMARHGATIHVHAFGAPHLVDPGRLVRSATRIYGDSMAWRWGELIPVPEAQVAPVDDGDVLDLEGLRFRAIETPGHARHHHAFALKTADGARIAFTGDAAACRVAARPEFVSLPTPPPEFDRRAWLASLDRLRAERFDRIFPTHFGRVDDVGAHLDRVELALRRHTTFVREAADAGLDRDEIVRRYTCWFLSHADATGLPAAHRAFYVTDTLAAMNVDGMMRWIEREGEAAEQPLRRFVAPSLRRSFP